MKLTRNQRHFNTDIKNQYHQSANIIQQLPCQLKTTTKKIRKSLESMILYLPEDQVITSLISKIKHISPIQNNCFKDMFSIALTWFMRFPGKHIIKILYFPDN